MVTIPSAFSSRLKILKFEILRWNLRKLAGWLNVPGDRPLEPSHGKVLCDCNVTQWDLRLEFRSDLALTEITPLGIDRFLTEGTALRTYRQATGMAARPANPRLTRKTGKTQPSDKTGKVNYDESVDSSDVIPRTTEVEMEMNSGTIYVVSSFTSANDHSDIHDNNGVISLSSTRMDTTASIQDDLFVRIGGNNRGDIRTVQAHRIAINASVVLVN
ncbi:hypothetical protein BDN72DRAFT_878984 [Pluteus cervinus]|uniref:Uncharacterized protein n=1 Tax=Pluteus cervinus TaxID=181527 RepID=A0ACD3ARD8_9AGAR|nr:hypothetical protein BDN72DRAFT_878984 [Pluteus cervinus]